MNIQICAALPGDMPEAGRVHAEAWQDSHRAFCAPRFIAAHTPARQTRYLSGKLAGGSRLYLMRLDCEAVGVVSVTGSLIEDLYILPRYQNRGLGTALLRYAMALRGPSHPVDPGEQRWG